MPADQSHDEGFFGERVASVDDERSAELDLMARLAGPRLRDRRAGREREPFTSVNLARVSVHEKP